MRKLFVFAALSVITLLSGCELIGDIFKAGAYTGIILVVIVIVFILWLLSKFRGRD